MDARFCLENNNVASHSVLADVPHTIDRRKAELLTAWQVPGGIQAGQHSVCHGGGFCCSKCVFTDEAGGRYDTGGNLGK